VDSSNSRQLGRLSGPIYRYQAHDSGDQQFLHEVSAPELVQLKLGAQVMLTKNMGDLLVNGSTGVVRGFLTAREYRRRTEARLPLPGPVPDSASPEEVLPYVEFFVPGGGESHSLLCQRHQWVVDDPQSDAKPLATRDQVPLILAYALSIHKAQGLTMPFLRVDLGRTFAHGQAYVALSRATTRAGMSVVNFGRGHVLASPEVVAFYNELETA